MKRFSCIFLTILILLLSISSAGLAEEITDVQKIGKLIEEAHFNIYSSDGMQIPLLEGEGWDVSDQHKKDFGKLSRYSPEGEQLIVHNEIYVSSLTYFYEDPEKAPDCYKSTLTDEQNMVKETIEIDGHPAIIATYDKYDHNGFYGHCGVIFYVRQNRLLKILLTAKSTYIYNVWPQDVPTITMDNMRTIAENISYDVSQAPVTEDDVAVFITAKNDPLTVSASKSFELDAGFVDPEKARHESISANYDRFDWYVIDTETGEKVEEVQLNQTRAQYDRRGGVERGRATIKSATAATDHQKVQVSNKLNRVIYAEVIAESASFHTKASYPIILLPSVKKMTLEPAKSTLYAGSNQTVELKLTYEPEDIPFVGLAWTAAKEGIVEIVPGENGTAIVKPVAKGNAKVTVTGTHGKKASAAVNVIDPVEQVELSFNGAVKAGRKVNIKVALLPKTAAVKDVEWSLDTEENIATINKNGVVTIAKDVPAGTAITVTCTALGAPNPIIGQIVLEVEE